MVNKDVREEILKNMEDGTMQYIKEPQKTEKKESLLKTLVSWPFRLIKVLLGIDGITHEVNKPITPNYASPQGYRESMKLSREDYYKMHRDNHAYLDLIDGRSGDGCNHDHDYDYR